MENAAAFLKKEWLLYFYNIATNAATIGIEIRDNSVEMQIPLDTRVTSRLYSIQSMDTFPAIGQPERIVEISKSMRSLIKNLRTRKVITGRTRSFRKEKRYSSRSVNTVENLTPARVDPMTIIANGVVVAPTVENRLTACCGRWISKR